MVETKVLNPQTKIVDRREEAKKILFGSVKSERESVAQSGLEKFSTAYESEKLQKVMDTHDLKNYLQSSASTSSQAQVASINSTFKDIIDSQTIAHVQTEQKVLSKPKTKFDKKVNAKLNFRGKLMISAFAIISVLFGFLAVYNAVDIKNINTEIQSLTTEVSQSENQLNSLWQTYSNLNNTNRISSIAGEQGMSAISNENKIHTELGIAPEQNLTKSTNWFDALCDFLGSLFK